MIGIAMIEIDFISYIISYVCMVRRNGKWSGRFPLIIYRNVRIIGALERLYPAIDITRDVSRVMLESKRRRWWKSWIYIRLSEGVTDIRNNALPVSGVPFSVEAPRVPIVITLSPPHSAYREIYRMPGNKSHPVDATSASKQIYRPAGRLKSRAASWLTLQSYLSIYI